MLNTPKPLQVSLLDLMGPRYIANVIVLFVYRDVSC